MNCPVCGGRAVGKVGTEQFYCWDCCVEFRMYRDSVEVYEVAEDGTLLTYDANDGITL